MLPVSCRWSALFITLTITKFSAFCFYDHVKGTIAVNIAEFMIMVYNIYQCGTLVIVTKSLIAIEHELSAIYSCLSIISFSLILNWIVLTIILILSWIPSQHFEYVVDPISFNGQIYLLGTWSFIFIGWYCKDITNITKQRTDTQLSLLCTHTPFLLFYCKIFKYLMVTWTLYIFTTSYIYSQSSDWILLSFACIAGIMDIISVYCCNLISSKLEIMINLKYESELRNVTIADAYYHPKVSTFRKQSDSITNNIRTSFVAARGKYASYKYWILNTIMIISCIFTVTGAIIHFYKSDIIHSEIILVFAVAICGILVSIYSIITEYYHCKCCNVTIVNLASSDSKLRTLVIAKTFLLLMKQLLIRNISQSVWTYIFAILSFVSLFTIAFISYAFDTTFTFRLKNIRYPKVLYATYVISYFVTNTGTLTVIISNLMLQHLWRDVGYVPFMWLFIAKLYNNEISRLKDDTKYEFIDRSKIKGIQTNIGTIFHFAQFVICFSFGTFLYFILSYQYHNDCNDMNGGSTDWKRDCKIYSYFYYTQIICAFLIGFNGIIALLSLQKVEYKMQYEINIPLLQM